MPSGDYHKDKGKCITWLRANVTHDGDECLIWPFFRDYEGYGRFGYNGIGNLKAHRWMCEMVKGPAPSSDHYAAHDCGNGHLGCVHPKHLAWKTHAENTEDFIRDGRGTKKRPHKLTQEQVQILLNPPADKTIVELSRQFGITYRHAKKIRQGISWPGGMPRQYGPAWNKGLTS